jgi:hypothetical protein
MGAAATEDAFRLDLYTKFVDVAQDILTARDQTMLSHHGNQIWSDRINRRDGCHPEYYVKCCNIPYIELF